MKELSIEEKAKAYDEAYKKVAIRFGSNVADEIFSQFEMSEDEKIRKAIRTLILSASREQTKIVGVTQSDMFAWLEKQGEQKPVDKVKPKFNVGEWITNGEFTWYIKKVGNGFYDLKSPDGRIVDDTISHVDEHFHLWTIQDAKDGDVLATEDWVFIFKKIDSNGKPVCYCHYDVDLGFVIDVNTYISTGSYFRPATQEQRETLFKAMHEAGYEWDSEKKELRKASKSMIGVKRMKNKQDK